MNRDKSARNKTICTDLSQGREYLERCVRQEEFKYERDTICIGDCMSLSEKIPDESFNLIIADPPYNMNKSFNGSSFTRKSDAEYEIYTRKWLEAIRHTLKRNGSIYVCCDWESSSVVGNVMGEMFRVRNRITWQREKGRGARSNWKNSMEDIWFATAGDEYTFNLDNVKTRRRVLAPYKQDGMPKDWCETEDGRFRDTCPSNFWDDITVPFWSMSENTAHPTQKPEKLIARLMLASSNAGDTVFDPFSGSGTTCVTAKKLGRHYLGIEKEEIYCIWAQQRLEMAESNNKIQGYEDGVFWERNAR